MVELTRIYTRTGDDGSTGLGDFSRTTKNDPRLVAYADVNEANAQLGVALAAPPGPEAARTGTDDLGPWIRATLARIQNDLFDVGADLCLPLAASYAYEPLRVRAEWIDELEADCDRANADLPKLRSFILPGGTPAAAALHVATTVVRRAERSAWAALDAYGDAPATSSEGGGDRPGGVNPLTARYLNRLSDLLFILSRSANRSQGDVLWRPGAGRDPQPERPEQQGDGQA